MSHIHNPRSLLLTAPHNLGDWVAKVPFIRIFKKHFPSCRLIVMGRAYIKPLVDLFEEVDVFIDFETFFNREDHEIVDALGSLNIDVCLHLLGVSKQIGPAVLEFAQRAGIPYRIGNIFRSKWTLFKKRGMGLTHNLRCPRILQGVHEYEWNLQPLQFFGVEVPKKGISWDSLLRCTLKPIDSPFLEKDRINLLLHPGSHGHAKEWPWPFYKKLIEKLESKTHVILTGSENERLRQPLEDFKSSCTDLRGKLDLTALLYLIQSANGLVVGSTGPAHLAALFKTPVCALFPKQEDISEKVWGPKSEGALILSAPNICLPCRRKLTDFNPALCTCMEGISVDKVYASIQPWLTYESLV